MELYPLKFTPLFKYRIQGGSKLKTALNKEYTEDSNVLNALYDLNKDPSEMNNLLGINPSRKDYEQKAEELRSCLLEWLQKNNSKHYTGVLKRKLM